MTNNRLLTQIGLTVISVCSLAAQDFSHREDPFSWPSYVDFNSWAYEVPVKASRDIPSITFTGRYANYTEADTWYPSWASDGHLYSPWTDGRIGDEECASYGRGNARTGQAKIMGDDPMNLEVISLGTTHSSALPYQGRYPAGSLVLDGIWYYGTYILESDQMTGPWKMVCYLKDFGPQAYFVNIPSKFISEDGKRAWLCYSANFAYNRDRQASPGNPKGSHYSLSLHEIIFDDRIDD